jgi:hypothetical protein
MLFKNKRKLIIKYFNNNLIAIEDELNKSTYKKIQKVIADTNSRGLLSSGATISGMVKVLNDEVFLKLDSSLTLLNELQKSMNIKMKDSLLEEISQMYSAFFKSYYINQYSKNIKESAIRYVGETLADNVTNDVTMNISLENIDRTIRKEIEELKIKNRVKQDDPSLRVSKKALLNSRIALCVSIIATAFTIFMKLFHDK